MSDVKGRKGALLLTLFLMAAGTVAIGLLPTYGTIGIWAPILLVAARLFKGSPPAVSGGGQLPISSNGRRQINGGTMAASSK